MTNWRMSNSANERTQNSNKKTIMPPDVFDALDDIEYPEFKELVQQEFKSACPSILMILSA
jgi:DNA polymerase epsilon subunit 3